MKTIVLASGSPRRKKLLDQLQIPFKVKISTVEEQYDDALAPADIVQMLASRKAEDVAQTFEDALIIGADTIVVFRETILEKPCSSEAARQMLMQLSEDTHSVVTGVSLYKKAPGKKSRIHTFFEETKVTFGNLNADDVQRYVASGSPMDKAGAYGIQDNYGSIFVKRIEGDYNTVVGFPLYAFYQVMQDFAPEYLTAQK
ncbi:Maf family protein [Fodinibius sediminis]|uniref:dTTP/UTP pyrophosphatase n=1 Tax=Fodinibius sediminis TaxID=1214077 RepID=A0A521F3C9_9BACT|nr:Maf family protein [Fodinibius sediminis]SMO90546.1 septum formation protein [Fodinibius sediminis]